MKTLVTGCTGLVGNNVVRQLLERGNPVRVLARATSDPRPLEGLDVEVFHGDVRDIESVKRACDGVERVVHAAGIVKIGWAGLDDQRAVNVEGTRNVAIAAREHGAKMVHVSSADAVGMGTLESPADEETEAMARILTPYVVTKREAEAAVNEQIAEGLWAAIVNPAFMLGPWDWRPSSGEMLLEVARGKGLFAPRGHFSVVDVRDVTAGILAAFERGQSGRRYLLCGENISYFNAWKTFAEVTGARRPLTPIGPAISWIAGRTGDLVGRISGNEPNVNSGAIAMAALPKVYNSTRAEDELGFQARPMRETVSDAWDWFREWKPL